MKYYAIDSFICKICNFGQCSKGLFTPSAGVMSGESFFGFFWADEKPLRD